MTDNPFDLYSNHPRFAEANAALLQAWDEAKRLAPDKPMRERAYWAEKHVYAVMQRFADVGATDTEPVWALRDLVAVHFGSKGGYL